MNNALRKDWTRDELILAINLYCKTPFGKIHVRNPDIIALAIVLDRTPGSISYKLANFASIDPSLNRKGASNVSKLDVTVWNEFFADWEGMAYESEKKFHEIFERGDIPVEDDVFPEGKTRDSIVKTRVNQAFFRKAVLSSYDSACCITGMMIEGLLVASHIIPWSVDTRNRTNPANGLCLNALHDRAFDCGLITIDEYYRVIISSKIRDLSDKSLSFFNDYNGIEINMPRRFAPGQEFLHFHRTNIYTP